jgi:hypothetical protein
MGGLRRANRVVMRVSLTEIQVHALGAMLAPIEFYVKV